MKLVLAFASLWFVAVVILALVTTLFLYFRAGRRELFERETLFDFALVLLLGGFLSGRICDFLIRSDYFNWSAKKLFFFNVYGGFNVWGAMTGALLLGFLFARRAKKPVFWQLLDFVCPALLLGASIFNLGLFLKDRFLIFSLLGIFFFALFWIAKRLEKIKRPAGFFACFFIVSVSLVNILLYPIKQKGQVFFASLNNQIIFPLVFLILFAFFWYFLAKRKIGKDLRSFSVAILLFIFSIKSMLTSVDGANDLARSIILLPAHLSKSVYFLVLLLGREVYNSILDFGIALGLRK